MVLCLMKAINSLVPGVHQKVTQLSAAGLFNSLTTNVPLT